MRLKSLILILVSGIFISTTFGQTLTERLILTDSGDSTIVNSEMLVFDRDGNYSLTLSTNTLDYFISNKDTFARAIFIGGEGYNGHQEIDNRKSHHFYSSLLYYYCKNAKGIRVYEAPRDNLEMVITGNTRENLAIITSNEDSAYYYINGKLICTRPIDEKWVVREENNWIAFSEKGNAIYFLKKDSLYYLYANDKIIDSSKYVFNRMAVTNQGDYIYTKRVGVNHLYIPEYNHYRNTYLLFHHPADTITLNYFSHCEYVIKENGAYYYSGDEDHKIYTGMVSHVLDNIKYKPKEIAHHYTLDDDYPQSYIAINGNLKRNIKPVTNITLIDKTHYLYVFREDQQNKINVNGTIISTNYDQLLLPTLDTNGNFACFGMKDYFLYKFVNGKQIGKPLSKFGWRATPLYISATGEAIYYYRTDDSVYLYRDDKLLFEPISRNTPFRIEPDLLVLTYNWTNEEKGNENSFSYIHYGENSYIVFNGKISLPLIPVKEIENFRNPALGSMVAMAGNDFGFFAIQKTGARSFRIIVNNEIYRELNGVDHIYRDMCFFDGKSLVFYGIKGLSIYQFKLDL